MLAFILARLKVAAGAVGIAVGTALIESIDQQLVANFGIGVPAGAKIGAIAAVTGFFINITDNVKLLSDGHAVTAHSLPAKTSEPVVLGADKPL